MNCPSAIWTRHGGRRHPTSLGKCFFRAWTTCRPRISTRSSSQNRPCGSTRRRAGRLPSTPRNSPRLSLFVSGALDILTPPETGAALAALYGATYQLEPAHGHNVLLVEGARRIAEYVIAWLVGTLAH